ncbi:MAG: glycosyltransferase family 9 protein [Candidatus Taylorbacteria bacterium]|nr:glycosyltransferase family 9 protein [Candidatus Taylorbacteria bacterium]
MKSALRTIVKNIMDTYISFECMFVALFQKPKTNRRKVLLLRKDVIGDFILFIPTIKHFRRFYKDAELYLVVNTVALDLQSQFPEVDHVIPYDGKQFRSNFFYRRKFFHNLAKEGFDIVVHAVYSREYICDRMVRVTGAKERIAFCAEGGKMTTDAQYTRLIDTPKELNEPDRNMYFLSAVIGEETNIQFPTLDISKFDCKNAKTLLESLHIEEKKYIVLLPGAGAPYRTWQLEKFAEVADHIASTHNLKILISGSHGDLNLCNKIYELMSKKDMAFVIAGQLDIPNFAHILHSSLFYFGSETGPLHLATAIQTPVVCILGAGHRDRFFPYGDARINRYVADDAAPCRGDGWKCSQNLRPGEIAPCIRNITTDAAKREIKELLDILR